MSTKIRIGTRKSKLALWQAYAVEHLLQKEGLDTQIVKIDTKGDKILDVSIAKIGSKGVFTEEIEDQLAAGQIDIAVHSAKDMQSELPEDFELIAFTQREKVNDVIVSHHEDITLQDTQRPLSIGTSSVRRVALLRHYYPHIKTVPIRGNLQTRMAKLESGLCDALLLAYAGVHRMQYDNQIVTLLPTDQFTPMVGQGSIAVEAARSLSADKKKLIRQFINHPETEVPLMAERSFLKTLQGGCSIPVFALAKPDTSELTISGGIVSPDGKTLIRQTVSGLLTQAEEIGQRLAHLILEGGGAQILSEIKSQAAQPSGSD
jgi:hydroxymethylbilane synthase